jgi:bifunctional UDP-N-acetylglucosamine pyrophosphorylase / glucosamine-1-phosphate N-acetyltransferase
MQPEPAGASASSEVHAVVLAAGKGTRMKSGRAKVLHQAAGLPLIDHVFRALAPLEPASIVVVIGHKPEEITSYVGAQVGTRFAIQEPQLGTGHALLQAEPFLEERQGSVLLLSGDVPLIRTQTLERLMKWHRDRRAAATVLTAVLDRPDGYGRIVRTNGAISAIVEHRDASVEQRAIQEINSGIYVFDRPPLFDALRQVGSRNAQGEYYLPDLVGIFRDQGLTVETVTVEDPLEILGVNSRQDLADVSAALRDRKNAELMASGVTIVDPATTWIHPDVVVGPDTILHPGVYLEGNTRIGSACEIHSGVRIIDSTLGDRVVISNFCIVRQSHVENGAQVGPFAQIRPDSRVGEGAHVGNFVELKKTVLGKGSKANHLAYLGDSTIGEKVNIGAGTITCNYDGVHKNPTIIEDGAFIGSDSQLIAPVRIGRNAYVAAGSSITDDVPPDSLAIARGRQVNKPGWKGRKKKP